eukprot:g16920.t1
MSRPMNRVQFHPRRTPPFVRQSGPGRTTLHLDLAAGGVSAPAPAPAPAAAAEASGGTAAPTAGAGGRGRGRGSRVSGLYGSATGRGRGGTHVGLRGRRGLRGVSTRRVPPFFEFWGLASGAQTSEAAGQRGWSQTQQQQQRRQRRQQNPVWFRSPEFLIFMLGLAALLALIVFISDLLSNRPFKPLAVLVFVTAGTYCVALARQQRSVAAAEQALVIEIIDGSVAESRRRVISKEDRRALFDYFKHRPVRPHREERAASNAQETSEGGGGPASVGGGEVESPAPSATQPACACSAGAEVGGEEGAQESTTEGCRVLNAGVGDAMVAPSFRAAAGLSPSILAVSGAVEQGGGTGEDREERSGPGSQGVVQGCQEPEAALAEETKESEVPERGTARGNSEQWSTAGSCIVCFGEYADGDELCRLPCRHTYHAECIDAWLDGPDHAWCPLCKSSLLPTVPRNSSTASAPDTANRTNSIDRISSRGGGVSASTEAVCAGYSAALVAAVRINSEASVRALLGPASATSGDGLTSESILGPALIEAAKAGAYGCITPLVDAGAVLNPVGDASNDSDLSVPLIVAAGGESIADKKQDDRAPDMIRLLVKLGAEVNAPDPSSGRSALHVASLKGRCDCMQALLGLGANPTTLDKGAPAAAAALLAKGWRNQSPLQTAVFEASGPQPAFCVSMLLSLLKASGDSQAIPRALNEKTRHNGGTILHLVADFGRGGCLKALMEPPEALEVALNAKDDDGTTPIALARQNGLSVDDVLPTAFVQVPFVPCCSGLVEATEKTHVACVKHIFTGGCPATGADCTAGGKDQGLDPLSSTMSHYSHNRCSKIVRLLLEAGFHPDGHYRDGAPLRHAAEGAGLLDFYSEEDEEDFLRDSDQHVELVGWLVSKGALVDAKDKFGNTPMHTAASQGSRKVVAILLDRGADPLLQNDNGYTSLHMAAEAGCTALMAHFIDLGIDVNTKADNGNTALHLLSLEGHASGVRMLLAEGADVAQTNELGWTPLRHAAAKDKVEALECLLDVGKGFALCVQFLVGKGVDVESKSTDGGGQTAMHVAASSKRNNLTGVVRVLAKFGACVDALDSSGQTPLHLAAASDDQLEIATLLLELGASCNMTDDGGRTPLWIAVKNGNLTCCSLLVARGADMALRDIQGKTALGASLGGPKSTTAKREAVMRLLIDLGCTVGEAEVDAASRGGLTEVYLYRAQSVASDGERPEGTGSGCSEPGGAGLDPGANGLP